MIAVEEPLMTQASIGKVYVDISVVLGWATMPIHQLLRIIKGRPVVLEGDTAPARQEGLVLDA